ncbi:MAG: TauD/TfdA family dioxygenase [Deltaproteobacteria bacterium]|nr:TauD/TfdA family dioxygenase [Deltaproteobacteria bacterium]
MNLTVKPLCPAIGAEIDGLDLSLPLDLRTRNSILDAFHEYIVLLFRGQDITVEQQNRFTTAFGEIGKRTKGPRIRQSEDDVETTPVMLVTNIVEGGKPPEGASANGDGELGFHHDTAFHEIPDIATILYGIEVSAHGGQTKLANMYRAYDNIPRDLRDKLEGRRVLQIYDYQRHRIDPKIDLASTRYYVQPIFITHPVTGKKALYVNRMMSARIEEMDSRESEAILNTLFDISEDDSIIYEHEWRVGDLLMWDNRCSIHARTPYPDEERRLLRRCTVGGKERLHA